MAAAHLDRAGARSISPRIRSPSPNRSRFLPKPCDRKPFVTRLLPESEAATEKKVPAGAPPRVVAERLLGVREVAALLSACAATIYRLCGSGELPHVRISNAARVRPSDLAV